MSESQLAQRIQSDLFSLQDLNYKEFIQKLVPNLEPKVFIGVRTPALRAYAKTISKEPTAKEYLEILPHYYFEENQLHGMLIGGTKDFSTALKDVETFLPYINNWATCDQGAPRIFSKHATEVYGRIKIWIQSEHPYTVRYAVGLLMSNYLNQEFQAEMLELVAKIDSDNYYVKMMVAWYFCTALVRQHDVALPYLQELRLEKWTHNKTIQKATESFQFSDESKAYLRTLRI